MDIFVWPGTVLIIVLVVIIGFRKSWSKIIQGIKLRKAPGGLEFEQLPQQQIEETKTDLKLAPTNPVPEQSAINDPVLAPKIQVFREELDKFSKDPTQREKVLFHAVALWQLNHENERTARYIFGSQLDILLLLNARPSGEPLENIRAIYDRAVQNAPAFYKSYPFESYLAYLERPQFVAHEGDRLTITPRGKAFLRYLVSIGDTLPRPN